MASVTVRVLDRKTNPVQGAIVRIKALDNNPQGTETAERTDAAGSTKLLDLKEERYEFSVPALDVRSDVQITKETRSIVLDAGLDAQIEVRQPNGAPASGAGLKVGDRLALQLLFKKPNGSNVTIEWRTLTTAGAFEDDSGLNEELTQEGTSEVATAVVNDEFPKRWAARLAFGQDTDTPAFLIVRTPPDFAPKAPVPVTGNIGVKLDRSASDQTDDVSFWIAIRNSTDALSFNNYLDFMNSLFCGADLPSRMPGFEKGRIPVKNARFNAIRDQRLLPFTDSDAYRAVKAATEAFVMVNCGVATEPGAFDDVEDPRYLARRSLAAFPVSARQTFAESYQTTTAGVLDAKVIPYLAVIRAKLPDIAIKLNGIGEGPTAADGNCVGILQEKLANPCLLELIWSYWHEEGMLVQTMNAVTRRFQNVRGMERNDPLAHLEMDSIRPLNNLIWCYLQDEQHRLSVVRRNYEYDHHYGLRLEGKAINEMRAADTRSKFLEAFHNLLRLCSGFFLRDDDTTVRADAFPVLNGLKEVHLILSQGAHNQFGEFPSNARVEMLLQSWLLARPEFREFLPTRVMVAYPEPWMDRVDAMKKLQGWTDTSVLHFRNLGVFGEQVLLSVRYGFWTDVNDPAQALNWARFWRPQIQGYIHAYRAATGVDLSTEADAEADATLPSVLLKRRLVAQKRSA